MLHELDRLDEELASAARADASEVRLDGIRDDRATMRRTLDLVDDLAYGVCEVCHGFIGIDRLMALPSAPRCITCTR